jgi:hypothetical protein
VLPRGALEPSGQINYEGSLKVDDVPHMDGELAPLVAHRILVIAHFQVLHEVPHSCDLALGMVDRSLAPGEVYCT